MNPLLNPLQWSARTEPLKHPLRPSPSSMEPRQELDALYTARLDTLKERAALLGIPRTGNVEQLRAKLIASTVLTGWDLEWDAIQGIQNKDLGHLLGVFGIKKTGSLRERRQRIWLHLNHDPRQLTPDALADLTKDQLHELCVRLELPRSGSKEELKLHVASVLLSQSGTWGAIKRSLRRNGAPMNLIIPVPADDVGSAPPMEVLEARQDEPVHHGSETETEPEVTHVDSPDTTPEEMPSTPPDLMSTWDLGGLGSTAPLEHMEARINFEARISEVRALANRLPKETELEDVIDHLNGHGIHVLDDESLEDLRRMRQEMDPAVAPRIEAESRFEAHRKDLLDIIRVHSRDASVSQADLRITVERAASAMGLDIVGTDLRSRLHALIDLELDLAAAAELDPQEARRTRISRILLNGSVHLSVEERVILERLEGAFEGFEQVVERILEASGGEFGPGQQARLVRFLVTRGYPIDQPNLRPRILAAAGLLGSELGYLSPAEVPRLPSTLLQQDDDLEDIVTELRSLAGRFKRSEVDAPRDQRSHGTSIRVQTARKRLDRAQAILDRMNTLD